MLLLKGEYGKEFVVDAMMHHGRVCTIAYYDYPIQQCFRMFDWHYVDSWVCGVDELIEDIKEIIERESEKDNKPFKFLVIYTDKTEDELAELLQWIKDNEEDFYYKNLNCDEVLVTCM